MSKPPSEPRDPLTISLLPVWLLGLMVLIGLALEIALYDTLLWQGKLPLMLLVLWPLWRRWKRS